jgi:hypothetical protein
MSATLTLRYNASTIHIAGLEMATADNEFTMNACPALTRSGSRMQRAKGEYTDPAEALKAARSKGAAIRKTVCKSCTTAAERLI